jgi:hypothetical protein
MALAADRWHEQHVACHAPDPAAGTARDPEEAAMSYGHAERNLATIRLLEAETRKLLNGIEQLDPDHERFLRDAAESAAQRLPTSGRAARRRPDRSAA